jgi:hypothetical protein
VTRTTRWNCPWHSPARVERLPLVNLVFAGALWPAPISDKYCCPSPSRSGDESPSNDTVPCYPCLGSDELREKMMHSMKHKERSPPPLSNIELPNSRCCWKKTEQPAEQIGGLRLIYKLRQIITREDVKGCNGSVAMKLDCGHGFHYSNHIPQKNRKQPSWPQS